MTAPFESLWPEDIASEVPTIPLTLIREQADSLGRLTNNIVTALVSTWTDADGDFWISFAITAPSLGPYQYKLFEAWHNTGLYPVRFPSENLDAKDESELRDHLRRLFTSPTTKRVVRALLAQARAATPDGQK